MRMELGMAIPPKRTVEAAVICLLLSDHTLIKGGWIPET